MGGGGTFKRWSLESDAVVHICDPSTQGVKTGGLHVLEQPGLHSKILSRKQTDKQKQENNNKESPQNSSQRTDNAAWQEVLRSLTVCPQRGRRQYSSLVCLVVTRQFSFVCPALCSPHLHWRPKAERCPVPN